MNINHLKESQNMQFPLLSSKWKRKVQKSFRDIDAASPCSSDLIVKNSSDSIFPHIAVFLDPQYNIFLIPEDHAVASRYKMDRSLVVFPQIFAFEPHGLHAKLIEVKYLVDRFGCLSIVVFWFMLLVFSSQSL